MIILSDKGTIDNTFVAFDSSVKLIFTTREDEYLSYCVSFLFRYNLPALPHQTLPQNQTGLAASGEIF